MSDGTFKRLGETDAVKAATFTPYDKLKWVARELAMRRRAYPQFVALGKMTRADAAHEIAVMEAIVADYQQAVRAAKDAALARAIAASAAKPAAKAKRKGGKR